MPSEGELSTMRAHIAIPRKLGHWSIENIEAAALIGFDANAQARKPVAGMKLIARLVILTGALR
jgi:hypothetical protein